MRIPPHNPDAVQAIDRCLPQTQCAQCGYPGCLAYSRAIAAGQAAINQCPPGGEVSIAALSTLLGREARPLNPDNGVHKPLQLAFIHEADCIGCKLCIQACPVDCIVGATKLMHTVIAAECTGCELCLPVCPTDCIAMVEPPADYGASDGKPAAPSLWPAFSQHQVEKSRRRAAAKRRRLDARKAERDRQSRARLASSPQRAMLAALERKRRGQREGAQQAKRQGV